MEKVSIGVSPHKLTRAELVAAHIRVREQLAQDGWSAGQYNYRTLEQQALHGGVTSMGRGAYWRKGDTVLSLLGKRIDEEQPGEDPETAGEWIQTIDLWPRDDSIFKRLEFDEPER